MEPRSAVWQMTRDLLHRKRGVMVKYADELARLWRDEEALPRSLFRTYHELQRLQAIRTGGIVAPAIVDVDVNVGQEEQNPEAILQNKANWQHDAWLRSADSGVAAKLLMLRHLGRSVVLVDFGITKCICSACTTCRAFAQKELGGHSR